MGGGGGESYIGKGDELGMAKANGEQEGDIDSGVSCNSVIGQTQPFQIT